MLPVPLYDPAAEAWKEDGICRTVDMELWFPNKGDGYSAKKARMICGGCPVAKPCLQYALSHNEHYGVWGGKTERQRRRMTAEGVAA